MCMARIAQWRICGCLELKKVLLKVLLAHVYVATFAHDRIRMWRLSPMIAFVCGDFRPICMWRLSPDIRYMYHGACKRYTQHTCMSQ